MSWNVITQSVFNCRTVRSRTNRLPGWRCLAQRLRRDSPVAAPGSSPPAGIPSASSAPQCSHDALPPTHGSQHRQDKRGHGDLLMICSDSLTSNRGKHKTRRKQWRRNKPKPLSQTERWSMYCFKAELQRELQQRVRRDGERGHQRTEWKRKRAPPVLPSMSSSQKSHAAVPEYSTSQSRIPVHTLATKH